MYQHDARAKHLRDTLDDVVQSCVSFVGVELNSASTPLLRYVSGMNQLTARRVYEHRQQNGPFRNRRQLLEVSGLGDATFVQAAGFLKIVGGDDPLDATWIHPENYAAAEEAAGEAGRRSGHALPAARARPAFASWSRRSIAQALAAELGIGRLALDDMIEALCKPGRDPREDLPPPIFRKDVVKFEDLQQGMELRGTVLNVVDFGAFVDVGLSDSGLVHISQLSAGYVRDPHDVVAVGDQVRVWVAAIDKERRRVALTMIAPGTERPRAGEVARGRAAARRRRSSAAAQPAADAPPAAAERTAAAAAPRRQSRAAIAAAAATQPPARANRRLRKASRQNARADHQGDGGRQGVPALLRRSVAVSSEEERAGQAGERSRGAAAVGECERFQRSSERQRVESRRVREPSERSASASLLRLFDS